MTTDFGQVKSGMENKKTCGNNGYDPLLKICLIPKPLYLTGCDSRSENAAEFPRNGIIAQPVVHKLTKSETNRNNPYIIYVQAEFRTGKICRNL